MHIQMRPTCPRCTVCPQGTPPSEPLRAVRLLARAVRLEELARLGGDARVLRLQQLILVPQRRDEALHAAQLISEEILFV